MTDEVATNGAPAAEAPAQPNAERPTTPPVDVEAIRKAARLEAQREANAQAQKREARLHADYQRQLKEQRQVVSERLNKAGYEGDTALDDFDVRQKARRYDEAMQEAQQAQVWQQTVAEVAEGYGLDANDPRLADAASLPDLRAKAAAAMKEDAVKAREAAAKEAEAARKAAAQAKVDNGDLETLGGAPSAPPPGLLEQYQKEMQAARGKGLAAGATIREKYRAKGLNV